MSDIFFNGPVTEGTSDSGKNVIFNINFVVLHLNDFFVFISYHALCFIDVSYILLLCCHTVYRISLNVSVGEDKLLF